MKMSKITTMTKAKDRKMPKMYRQGDVMIVAVDTVPDNAAEVPRTARGLVLAEGEVTGHAHRIPSRHAKLYRTEDDARYMRVTAGKTPAVLEHEEHKTACGHGVDDDGNTIAIACGALATYTDGSVYRCDDHRVQRTNTAIQAGSTMIPPGNYRVSIHREYQPGELPRPVAD